MSDKKVGRFSRIPISPTEQMERALSDPGTVNAADLPHGKTKPPAADKFREREERWRREQSMQDQQAAQAAEQQERTAEKAGRTPVEAEHTAGEAGAIPEEQGGEQGGGS
jgi:hypothetical protein